MNMSSQRLYTFYCVQIKQSTTYISFGSKVNIPIYTPGFSLMLWEASPVMSTLCLCGLAACGGRSPSRGPKLSPWSRRHRWPPVARHTGRSAPPPRGPWGRVNTDLNQCPRRAAWHHEIHWPPCVTQTQTVRKVTVAENRFSGEIQEWMLMSTGAVISSNHREFNSCLYAELLSHRCNVHFKSSILQD